MFGPKIKLDRDLYARLARGAEAAGYSSTEEFIRHTLEKAAAGLESVDSERMEPGNRGGCGRFGCIGRHTGLERLRKTISDFREKRDH